MMDDIMADVLDEMTAPTKTEGEEEFDALSSLERDVLRRTQQVEK
jgi:hypothetical protein